MNLKMVDPERYCDGISELDNFLSVLRGSFKSHSHLFPHGGPNQVQYMLNSLGSCSSYANPTQRNTKLEDPNVWGQKIPILNHPAMNYFDLLEEEIRKTYGDKDQEIHSAILGC